MLYAPFPDHNVIAKAAMDYQVYHSSDWQKAKDSLNIQSADRVIDRIWSQRKSEIFKEAIGESSKAVLITQPSTSGQNVIPIRLAGRIKDDIGVDYLIGDSYFNALHPEQSKHVSFTERFFHTRFYAISAPDQFREKIAGRNVYICEDILTTGGSVAQFFRAMEKENILCKGVVALFGDKRLNLDAGTFARLEMALEGKGISIDLNSLSGLITRSEAGQIIRQLNSIRNANEITIKKFTGDLQRVLHERAFKGLGRNQEPTRNASTKGRDRGDEGPIERLQAGLTQPIFHRGRG